MEIKTIKVISVDRRFIRSRIGDIKKDWEDAEAMELEAIEWGISRYLEKYPFGSYDKIKEKIQD